MRMRNLLVMTALAVGLSLGTQTDARAAFGDFSYSTFVSATSTPPPPTPTTTTASVTQGGVEVTLTGLPSPAPANALPPGTDIVFGNIAVNASALANGTTQAISIAYDFRVTVTDLGTPNSTAFNDITGMLGGSVTRTASGTFQFNITNTYLPTNYTIPPSGAFPSGTIYQVFANAFTPPGGNPGTFGAHVTANAVPEPSSVVLIGLGGLGAVFALRRRRARA